MKKTLDMKFRTSGGNEAVISLANPREDLSLAQVMAVMEDIVTRNVFVLQGQTLAETIDAKIRISDVQELA